MCKNAFSALLLGSIFQTAKIGNEQYKITSRETWIWDVNKKHCKKPELLHYLKKEKHQKNVGMAVYIVNICIEYIILYQFFMYNLLYFLYNYLSTMLSITMSICLQFLRADSPFTPIGFVISTLKMGCGSCWISIHDEGIENCLPVG